MTRPPLLRTFRLDPHELVVDNFAGGCGASTGIEAAIGRPVDIAVNHDPEAIAVHRANHPETRHYCESIWEVDPREACGSRPVGLAWFSPDCTHFSRAKGNKPREQGIRGLAWVVIRWAREVAPRVIVLENVEEFQTWGPLLEDGRPDPARNGETFREWLAALVDLGYSVEFRSLVAADFGAPTTRRRLFIVARRDGASPAWPTPTHGAARPAPWRPAAEVIDWSLPCPSIFGRSKPLAEATLRRIAAGIRKYVVEAPDPFIIKYHGGREWRGQSAGEPLHTIDTANRYGLAVPLVTKHYGGVVGHEITRPLGTVTAVDHHALSVAFLTQYYGQSVGREAQQPVPTVTGSGHIYQASAFLTKFYGTSTGSDVRRPVPTVTASGKGGGHLAEVRAFLLKYYGTGGQDQDTRAPLHTVTAKARFGLGVVTLAGEPFQIVDIGMRMLQPHELFAAQGFPGDYVVAPDHGGRPLTKTAQIRLAGNSVCPPVAEAIVAANVGCA